eukprot:39436-Chlamydomonas_euryale.AAC.1
MGCRSSLGGMAAVGGGEGGRGSLERMRWFAGGRGNEWGHCGGLGGIAAVWGGIAAIWWGRGVQTVTHVA